MASSVRWWVSSVGAVCLGYGLFACFTNDLPAIDTSGRTPGFELTSGGSSSEDSGLGSCTTQGTDGGCNNLAPCGSENFAQQVAQTTPTETGGSITPGTYVMSGVSLYTGSGGASTKLNTWQMETFTLGIASTDAGTAAGDGGTTQSFVWNDAVESNAAAASTRSGTATAVGNQLTFTGTCPSPITEGYTYTATPMQITIDVGASGSDGEMVITYALQ